jgi:hypothetical protein
MCLVGDFGTESYFVSDYPVLYSLNSVLSNGIKQMNLITEYASRPEIAIGLFKMPSSVVAVTDHSVTGKNYLKPRILTFSPVLGRPEEVLLRLHAVGMEESPIVQKEQTVLLSNLFKTESLKSIFEGCRMVPYSFDHYPADIVYNDPPQSTQQETSVIKFFQTIQNSLKHQEYRRMIVWCDFITQNGSSSFLRDYGESIAINGFFYVNPENVKKHDKGNWKKWLSYCERLSFRGSTDWANEILFAKCLPRMNKKDMKIMSIPICEDVDEAA